MSNEMLRQCADKGFVVGDKWRASPRQLVWRSHTLSVNGRGSGLYSIIELWPLFMLGRDMYAPMPYARYVIIMIHFVAAESYADYYVTKHFHGHNSMML